MRTHTAYGSPICWMKSAILAPHKANLWRRLRKSHAQSILYVLTHYPKQVFEVYALTKSAMIGTCSRRLGFRYFTFAARRLPRACLRLSPHSGAVHRIHRHRDGKRAEGH